MTLGEGPGAASGGPSPAPSVTAGGGDLGAGGEAFKPAAPDVDGMPEEVGESLMQLHKAVLEVGGCEWQWVGGISFMKWRFGGYLWL